MNPFFAAGQLYLLLTAPAAQEDMLFGKTWYPTTTGFIAYAEDPTPTVPCISNASNRVSSCIQTLQPFNKYNGVYIVAKAVLLHVKHKLTLPPTLDAKYCQIDSTYASTPAGLTKQNHALFLEAWGKPGEEDRKIVYGNIIVPVSEEGKFTLSVRKQIIGNCQVDVAVTLMGYYQ